MSRTLLEVKVSGYRHHYSSRSLDNYRVWYWLPWVEGATLYTSVDHTIIANCSTQFYGRANSPQSREVIQDQLRQRGGSGQDIARLQQGQFYAVSESLTPPTKVTTPLCLSYHPPTPLDEIEVLQRAKISRQL